MATATINNTKLTGPDNWKAWNNKFIAEARSLMLWDRIDPTSDTKGEFLVRPKRPALSSYPKLMSAPATATRASSETLAHGTPGREPVDRDGSPANVSEMTTTGKENYKNDVAAYQFDYRLYKEENDSINKLIGYIRQTVDPDLFDLCCNAEGSLDAWYASLKENAGTTEGQEMERVLKNYAAACKPLTRRPNNKRKSLTQALDL